LEVGSLWNPSPIICVGFVPATASFFETGSILAFYRTIIVTLYRNMLLCEKTSFTRLSTSTQTENLQDLSPW
jgi:hypothetical protein